MCAVAGDLYLSFCIFAALAAIRFVLCYGAPAGRMRTFFLLNIRHYALPFLYKSSRGTQDIRRDGFLSIPTRLLGSLLTLDAASRP